jgi:hypothetical protein
MVYWKSRKFWVYYGGFWLLSLVLVGGFGALIVKADVGAVKVLGVIGGSVLLASLLAWRLARDAVVWDRKRAAGRRAG